jgi:hypothetical protein
MGWRRRTLGMRGGKRKSGKASRTERSTKAIVNGVEEEASGDKMDVVVEKWEGFSGFKSIYLLNTILLFELS